MAQTTVGVGDVPTKFYHNISKNICNNDICDNIEKIPKEHFMDACTFQAAAFVRVSNEGPFSILVFQ